MSSPIDKHYKSFLFKPIENAITYIYNYNLYKNKYEIELDLKMINELSGLNLNGEIDEDVSSENDRHKI